MKSYISITKASIIFFILFISNVIYSQQQCIDLGTGLDLTNDEYVFIDFFKNGGRWEPIGDNNHPWYKVYSLDTFKVVNGSYWHWDADWSGTVNNEAWGDNWADCYISYYDMMMDQGYFRPDGYPVEFPVTVHKYHAKSEDPLQPIDPSKPVDIQRISRRIYFPNELPRSGWIMKWEGTGRISFQGLENVVADAGTNSTQNGNSWHPTGNFCGYNYEFSSTGNGRIETDLHWMIHGWVFNILESEPNDPIRNVVFLFPGLEDEYDAGQIFQPQFLERMRQFSSLRFMGYNSGNDIESRTIVSGSNPFHDNEMLEWLRWEERTPENWYRINNGNGGIHEYIIELANLTNTDPWVNIPYCAGEAYTEELVNQYMAGLNPDLTLYIEVGNEMWNFAPSFQGFRWQAAKRVTEYPGLGDVEARGAHINRILGKVTEVAGERNLSRIKRVYAGFPRYADINNRTLNYIDQNNWDAFATTWYFDLSEDNSANNECRDPASGNNWKTVLYEWHQANPNNQAGFNQLYRDAILNEFRCSGGYSNNSDVLLANYYGKEIVCYEGGNHTFYGCENAPTGGSLPGELEFNNPTFPDYITNNSFINAVCLADQSEEMGEVYSEIIDSMQSAGYRLANHLTFAGRSSCYGVWSFIQPQDMLEPLSTLLERYPKYRVFSERISQNNCDQEEVILDTNMVGPGLSILLDGIDDYVEGQSAFVPDESSDYTLEAWFNPLFTDSDQILLSFSNDGSNSNYNAIILRNDRRLVWETGNNSTSNARLIGPEIETNKWYHVAVSKNNQRYTLYLNGQDVASNNFALSAVPRNNFTIGAIENSSVASSVFAGQIDEVRLWDVARSVNDLRGFMCKKVVGGIYQYENLRSYYRFDMPDYSGFELFDNATGTNTGRLHNITISQRSRFAISGAAIGDYSVFRYEGNWNNVSVSVTHPQGDLLAVSNIGSGSPDGAHLYIIEGESHYNSIPEYYNGISNERVFGVFMANGNAPNYDLTYAYNGNPDAASVSAEDNLRLIKRSNYSSENWLHSGAQIDITANTLTVNCKENTRGEYNLGYRNDEGDNLPGSGMALYNGQVPTEENQGLIRYLDIEDYTVTFWGRGWGNVYNFSEKLGLGSHRFSIGADSQNRLRIYMRNRTPGWDSEDISSGLTHASGDEWVHYAIIKSGPQITVYVNGIVVMQDAFTNSFGFKEMRLFHDPSWQVGNYPGGRCGLSIDELTVWNTALDENTIRNWMCKKINSTHPYECENLVLYFNFDQGHGNILEDRRGPSDISLVSVAEGFNYITSGAAVGDESMADYDSPQSTIFTHPDGDSLEVVRSDGTSNGVHIYRIDHNPPIPSSTDNISILSLDSTRYWGMYVVKSYSATPTYTLTNYYQNNSQVNLSNENELRLLSRFDNADAPWNSNISVTPDVVSHTLTLNGQSRGEYVLGGTSVNTFNDYIAPETPVFLPETDTLNISTICGNSTGLIYAVDHDPSAETYIWTLPEGLQGFSTTDSIIVNAAYTGDTTQSLILSVVAVNAYGESTPPATYNILVLPPPTTADAGPDQLLIPPVTNTVLEGNTPSVGEIGEWSAQPLTVNIIDVNNPISAVNNLEVGYNTLTWSISNGACPPSIDSMLITVAPPPQNVLLVDGSNLPLVFCQGETVQVIAIPAEDVPNDGYFWTLPEGISLISQNQDTATLQIGSGIGGRIQVAAIYSGEYSGNFETHPVNINVLPNTPQFIDTASVLCLNVDETISIQFDPTIDSVEWTLPEGVYPVNYPKSTSESIEIQAINSVSGYISAKVFNDGCSATSSIDSFSFVVNEAPDAPILYLGTDGGVADQFCGNENALLWVRNNDTSAIYEWNWDTRTNLIEYLTDNNSAALFQMPTSNNEIQVRTVRGSGACSASEWFTYNGWTQAVSPAVINSVTITNPAGQDNLDLQTGQVYTLEIDGTGDHYYWDIPPGFELIDDGNIHDNINQIRVLQEAAGTIDIYTITLRGCSSHAFSLSVSTPNALMPPEYVSGDLSVCQGTNLNITVTNVGATQYIWILPNGVEYTTTIPVLDVPVTTPMSGMLEVVATDGVYTATPTLIVIEIMATNIEALGFVDEYGEPVEEIEICNGDVRRPIYHRDAHASSYIWEINGSAILFYPRWEEGHEGDNNYDLENRTSPVDTMMPVSWTSWRCNNDGSDGGYIIVTAVNGCGGAHVTDSIYYYWQESLSTMVPEFVEAPTELCVGSSVNYEIRNLNGADEYIWSLPNGLVASEIVTTEPAITADVVNGTGGTLSVYARGSSCGGSSTIPQTVEPINISGEAVDFHFIEAPTAACPNDTLTYIVNDIGVSTYNWSVPEGLRTTLLDDSDDTGIIFSGIWREAERNDQVNQQYRYASNDAERSVTYTPDLPYSGIYKVSISGFRYYSNVADMPVTVNHSEGSEEFFVDIRVEPEDEIWRSIGEYYFDAGTSGSVEIRTHSNGGGNSLADAVKFEIQSIPNGTTHSFPVGDGAGGAVCVSVDVPQCQNEYTICSAPVNLGGTLNAPIFTEQHTSVCVGETYNFMVRDTGADSYTWILPDGVSIEGNTGIVAGQERSVTVTIDSEPVSDVQIGVVGILEACGILSDTIYTETLTFDGPECNVCNDFGVIISDVEFINPAECLENGSIIIHLNGALQNQAYSIDYNYDQVEDVSGIVSGDSIVVINVEQGTEISALTLTEIISGCNVYASETGVIETLTPATIDQVIVTQPVNCNENGEIQVIISGASNGSQYYVDYSNDGTADDTCTVANDTLHITPLLPGTIIQDLNLLNSATQCLSVYSVSDTILSPSGISISGVQITNPARCDETGSIRIGITGGAETELFNIDLSGNGAYNYTTGLNNDTLYINNLDIGTEILNLEVSSQVSGCLAIYPGEFEVMAPGTPEVTLAEPDGFCDTDTTILLNYGNPEGGTYRLSNAEVVEINPNELGTGIHNLVYTYTDSLNCISSDSVEFEVYANPEVEINGDEVLCPESPLATYSSPSSENLLYQWVITGGSTTNATNNPDIIIDWNDVDTGKVFLQVIHNNTGCTGSDSLTVILSDTTAPVIESCVETAEFEARFDGLWYHRLSSTDDEIIPIAHDLCSAENLTILFETNDSVPVDISEFEGFRINMTQNQQINWIVMDQSGNIANCITSVQFNINMKPPSAFSPNGDEVNDTWRIDFLMNYPEAVVKVFDRWGKVVFVSERGYPSQWNGMHKGKTLPVDTYYYIIDLGQSNGALKGYLNIVY